MGSRRVPSFCRVLKLRKAASSLMCPCIGFAGCLPSIGAQRNIQSSLISEIIRDYQIRLFLSIGCAFGNELNEFYASCEHFRSLDVVAIDLADVNRELHSQAFARALGQRLEWEQLDLLDIRALPRYGMFY